MININKEKSAINQEILENTADLCNDEIKDHTDCQECGEDYLFLMKDKEHEFSIGLRTILSCLAIAEKEEAVPKLPYEWWEAINGRY